MNDKDISKLLSLVLRHQPEKIGITLDQNGWAQVEELLAKLQQKRMTVDLVQLKRVVETNNKQRFSFNPDQTKIRANQGHSVLVDVGLPPATPPEFLYHGTSVNNAAHILKDGVKKQSRLHVHLSSDLSTALQVGSRHGKPYVFTVLSGQMHLKVISFYLSENNVWLTDYVAPAYLQEFKLS
ncbi:RNA 2'-phosphotransferase [Rufibacter hautae]|uniref:Probable RNA 2'-phosphotransferase n=1 Tax=Rufibacter hautae TaxID=2595005 RepID=A0A5B6TB31_9BACT|nr:RNA 2'-phosphotransferase [Rufibacter hautae]KAA3437679.1 RNA 2'-phosphotransferase [Rufibacter hautae]